MSNHPWRFFRAGGVDQVVLETADDLRNLGDLDLKLWVALSCPVHGHQVDARTMALIDTDGDGRVRAPEVLAAVKLLTTLLREPAEIFKDPAALPLAGVRDDAPEGRTLLAAARAVLTSLGKGTSTQISVADFADTGAIFTQMAMNGDGVVQADVAGDPALAQAVTDIVTTMGADKDRSGKDGVSVAKVEAFFAACAAFAAWADRGRTEAAVLLPLGAEGTPAAWAAVEAVRGKVDDFYARGRVASFDGRSLAALNRAEADYVALAAHDLSAAGTEVESFPLAQIAPGGALPLGQGVNPAWAARIAGFVTQALVPLHGEKAVLTAAEWDAVNAALAPYGAWQAARAGSEVAGLGVPRVTALLADDTKARLLARIAEDEARRADAEGIVQLERLVRYHAHLGQLLRNFVNFADFYGRRRKAVFQAGTVYLDQRSCDLVLAVQDPGRHASMAGSAGAHLVYLDCVRKSDGRKVTVCAAVTDGDSDNLLVGRNGLYFDREGRDYDATVTKIVDNPISIRQAFWSPYKKFLKMVEDFVAKRAADAEAKSNAAVAGAAETVAHADTKAVAPAASPPASKPMDIGTVAAIGVAVGGITAALGALLQGFFGLGIWMPLGILGLILCISGPSMLIAALKLRRRNIGPLLDADGWAVNTQARINIPFGRSLTQLAVLPPGSKRDVVDPFAEKKPVWPYLLGALAVIGLVVWGLVHFGVIELPWGSATEAAPAEASAAEAAPAAAPAAP